MAIDTDLQQQEAASPQVVMVRSSTRSTMTAVFVFLAAMTAVMSLSFFAARALPRVGYWLAFSILLIVLGLWALLALSEADGPGGALGVAIVAAASLLCLGFGVGLVAGAMSSIAPIIGFGLGLAVSCAIGFWLVPFSSPYVFAVLLLVFCIGGCAAPAVRERLKPRA